MRSRMNRVVGVSLALSLVVGTAVCTASERGRRGTQATPKPAPKHSAAWHKTQKLLERRVPKIEFSDIELKDVISFLRDVTGLTLVVDWKALAKVKVTRTTAVTVSLQDVSTRGIVRLIFWQLSPDGRVGAVVGEDGVIRIGLHGTGPFAPPPGAKPRPLPVLRTRRLLNQKLPRVSFREIELSVVVTFIRNVSGLNIVVHWGQLATVKVRRGTTVTLDMRNVPVGTILDRVVRAACPAGKVVWRIDEDGVVLIHVKPSRPATRPAAKEGKKKG